MYSQCPDCQTRFRVTAEMLRAARGTVRCGRCGSAFDALERLSDTIPPAERTSQAGPGAIGAAALAISPGDEPPVLVLEDREVEDITLEGERISIAAFAGEPAAGVDLDSTDELAILRLVPDSAYPEEDEQVERGLEGLGLLLDGEPAPPVEPSPAPAPAPAAAPVRTRPAPVAEVAEPMPLSAQRWRRPVEDEEPEAPAGGSVWATLAWSIGIFALAVVLAAQVIHHFRQDLVRHPQIGPPLRAAYERLGLALLPNWDLAAFELRQWGNAADAAAQGRMVVRANLTNRAGFAQPHPILRLELEDRFGGTVATRDFEPVDYLKNPAQATRLIAPGASSEAELVLADPGRDAVGYRLDVCLRETATLLLCARGPG